MIPKKLRLGPFTYEVTTDVRRLRLAENEEGCFLYGRSQYATQVINIDDSAAPDRQRVTLIHEILHTYLWDLDLPKETEELVCRIASNGLTDALRSNPALVAYLTEKNA